MVTSTTQIIRSPCSATLYLPQYLMETLTSWCSLYWNNRQSFFKQFNKCVRSANFSDSSHNSNLSKSMQKVRPLKAFTFTTISKYSFPALQCQPSHKVFLYRHTLIIHQHQLSSLILSSTLLLSGVTTPRWREVKPAIDFTKWP